jgi:hypothetical protein
MHQFWNTIIAPVFSAVRPGMIIEVGCGEGLHTRKVLGYCAETGAVLHAIDTQACPAAVAGHPQLRFHRGRSLELLPHLEAADAVLIDGDHNWYTVFHELRAVQDAADRAGRRFPLVFLHDTAWPYGRRDMYYDPSSVPESQRQAIDEAALLPGRDELAPQGVNPHYAHALHEGGPRNGVRTAVEDFVAGVPRLRVFFIPGLYGLAVLVTPELLEAHPEMTALFDAERYPLTAHLESTERERLRAFAEGEILRQELARRLRRWQAEAAAHAAERVRALTVDWKIRLLGSVYSPQIALHEALELRYQKRDALLRTIQRKLAIADARIAEMKGTLGWKLGAPARFLSALIRVSREGNVTGFLRDSLAQLWKGIGRPFPRLFARLLASGEIEPSTLQPAEVIITEPLEPRESAGEIRFTIVLSLHSVEELLVRRTLNSVLEQSHQAWELLVFHDAEDGLARRVLAEYVPLSDGRIVALPLDRYRPASLALERVLELANGAYLLPMEQDDLLHPHLLFAFAERLVLPRPADVLLCGVAWETPEGIVFERRAPSADHRFSTFLGDRVRGAGVVSLEFLRSCCDDTRLPLDKLGRVLRRGKELPLVGVIPALLYRRSTMHR